MEVIYIIFRGIKDLSFLDLVILLIALFVLVFFAARYYFSYSKKDAPKPLTNEYQRNEGSNTPMQLSPQITVVFQKDLSDDEELSKEIADMYLSNRAFYYTGRTPTEILPEKEIDVFVKYENVDFQSLAKVEV